MPEILRMFGMRFYFYSREHEPIHVHVKNADGRAKNFEIKSIEDKRRRSLEGLFGINPELNGIQQELKGKHVVIFDDNISSGATLDDICLELQKHGVASILPITLAIIPKTVYGQEHESLKNR